MQAYDVMTHKVFTASPQTTVEQLATLMIENHISALPIVDENSHIVGLVSEGDLMRRVEGADMKQPSWWLELFSGEKNTSADFVKAKGQHAGDIMTKEVRTIPPETPVGEIAEILEGNKIKRMPVVENGRLVGIVSRANLLHALAARPESVLGPNPEDRALRLAVIEALSEIPGLNITQQNVIVKSGNVIFWGIAHSKDDEAAAQVAIENIQGVSEISINLMRIPALSWGI